MSDPVQTIQLVSTAVAAVSTLLTDLSNLAPKVITAAAFIATMLRAPDESSGPLYKKIYEMINAAAFNFGRAKNANPADTPK